MRPVRLTLLFTALAFAAGARAEVTVSWSPRPRQWPIARIEAPLVYDSVRQRVLLFAGYDHNYNRNNEVWEYEPVYQYWTNVTPTGGAQPVPRSGSAAAYDPVRQRVVLFGGLDDARVWLGDTWEWDCNARTWTQVATGGTPGTDKPTPRQGVAMAYDPAGDRMVLFGGVDQNQFYRDTWIYAPDTQNWSKLTTGVSSAAGRLLRGRGFHSLAVSADNRVFLFAGEGFNGDFPYPGGAGSVLLFEDLWELVGTTWTDRTPSGIAAGNQGACATASACPGKAAWRAFAYDPGGHRLVTQGGYWFSPDYTTAGNLKAAWAYSLASGTWSQISANIAGGDSWSLRDSHALVYAASAGKLILFGGYLSDVWELQGSTWTSPPAFDPRSSYNVYTYPRQDYQALAWDSARGRILGVSAGAHEVWRADPANWNWVVAAVGSFTERVGHALAYNSVLDRLVMFGGRCKSIGVYQTQPDGVGALCGAAGTLYNDTRSFNPGTNAWTQLAPGGGPPAARWDHAFVYDPANNEYLLFGGRNSAGTALGDTWVLSCATVTSCSWISVGGTAPSARYGHAMAYDPVTGRVVLFGGHNGSSAFGDVWAWNGATNTWSPVTPAGTPPSARVHAALAQADRVVPGLLMFGGRDAAGVKNDAWLLSGVGGGSPQWQPVTVAGPAPAPREQPKLVFIPTLNRLLMYGGFDASGLLPGDGHLATLFVKGDFDASGSTDLVLRSPSAPSLVLWSMDGVTRLAEQAVSHSLGTGEQVVGADDFNADGRNDLVLWNSSTGVVTFWFMQGATRVGTATLSGAAPLSLDWKPAATADFNHDGRPDLLWRNVVTQKLAIWVLGGTTWLGAYVPNPDQAVDANWEVVGALDYNADGNTDLLWYNPDSGKIVFWYLDYNAVRITGQFANPANAGNNNWKVLAAGDYGTGGGPAGVKDIVWRNADSGRFVVWYMDTSGTRVAGTFTNPMEPSPDPTLWTIVGPK